MKTQTNWTKYINKNYLVHTRDESGKPAPERDPEEVARENREKEVCLNCTKKKCTGTYNCFRKERNKNDKD